VCPTRAILGLILFFEILKKIEALHFYPFFESSVDHTGDIFLK
jgi:hypothetical protein